MKPQNAPKINHLENQPSYQKDNKERVTRIEVLDFDADFEEVKPVSYVTETLNNMFKNMIQ